MTDRMTTWTVMGSLLALVAAAPALAHDEAKTPISPSMIFESRPPKAADAGRAFDESIKREPPAHPNKVEWQQQPDGSYRYGNTTIIIRRDCPPGSEHFEPPPLPGRR